MAPGRWHDCQTPRRSSEISCTRVERWATYVEQALTLVEGSLPVLRPESGSRRSFYRVQVGLTVSQVVESATAQLLWGCALQAETQPRPVAGRGPIVAPRGYQRVAEYRGEGSE